MTKFFTFLFLKTSFSFRIFFGKIAKYFPRIVKCDEDFVGGRGQVSDWVRVIT